MPYTFLDISLWFGFGVFGYWRGYKYGLKRVTVEEEIHYKEVREARRCIEITLSPFDVDRDITYADRTIRDLAFVIRNVVLNLREELDVSVATATELQKRLDRSNRVLTEELGAKGAATREAMAAKMVKREESDE